MHLLSYSWTLPLQAAGMFKIRANAHRISVHQHQSLSETTLSSAVALETCAMKTLPMSSSQCLQQGVPPVFRVSKTMNNETVHVAGVVLCHLVHLSSKIFFIRLYLISKAQNDLTSICR